MANADDLLFDRRCKVTISIPSTTPGDYKTITRTDLQIPENDQGEDAPRVRFKITKSDAKEPNNSEVIITNLSNKTRAKLNTKGSRLVLEAGYAGSGTVRIYSGDIRTVDQIRKGGDWETTLKLGDGERSFRFARYSNSWKAGTASLDIVKAIANATGINLGNLNDQSSLFTKVYQQGYAVHGPVNRSLDRLMCSLHLKWSIQDGALQIRKPGDAFTSTIPLISVDSGMIDSPEMGTPEKKGKPTLCKVKFLLRPVKPGEKIHVRSERYDSDLYCKKVEHEGDTRGGPWYTTVEGLVLQQKKVA